MNAARRGAAAPLLLWLLFGCDAGGWPGAELLSPGRWAAELTHDPSEPPVAIMLDVSTGPGVSVVDPDYFGFPAGQPAPAVVTGDSAAFDLPTGRFTRRCTVAAGAGGVLEGVCAHRQSRWTLRMAPLADARSPMGVASWLLEGSDRRWRTVEGERVNVHVAESVPAGRLPAGGLEAMAARADTAVVANERYLGAAGYPRRLDLFLLADREEMRSHSGYPSAGHADAFGTAALVSGYGAGATSVQHELMHVMSHNLWGGGSPPADWLREGVAVAATGRCQQWALQPIAARLDARGQLIPVDALVHRFREQDDLIAYLQAAAVVEHLRQQFGAGALRALWQQGERGLLDETGLTLEGLDRQWRESLLDHSAAAEGVQIEAIRGVGCG